MKCSLILATLGRDKELLALLGSLQRQSHKDFELIVIDQNKDSKIDSILAQFAGFFPLRHVKVEFTGLARARDHGIRFASGKIVAFPDDDCVYEDDVLERVVAEFHRQKGLAILVVGSYDFSKTKFSQGVNCHKPCYFSKFRMMGVEFTQFFNLDIIKPQQFYLDHDFGIGSKYGGAEGFELLYRLLRARNKAFYTPHIRIYHADKDSYATGSARILRHSEGIGAYIRKFTKESDPFMLYYFFRKMLVAPVVKMVMAAFMLDSRRFTYSLHNLVGVWRGFCSYGR